MRTERGLMILSLVAALGLLQGCGGGTTAAPEAGPVVGATFPRNGAQKVGQNVKISITFSDDLDTGTVDNDHFLLTEDTAGRGSPVSGKVQADGDDAEFVPDHPLQPFTVYTATVRHGVRCRDGGGMDNDYSWSFTTGSDLDTTPPQVTDTAFGVQFKDGVHQPVIVAFFSEVMDPASVNARNITLTDRSGTAVPL